MILCKFHSDVPQANARLTQSEPEPEPERIWSACPVEVSIPHDLFYFCLDLGGFELLLFDLKGGTAFF